MQLIQTTRAPVAARQISIMPRQRRLCSAATSIASLAGWVCRTVRPYDDLKRTELISERTVW